MSIIPKKNRYFDRVLISSTLFWTCGVILLVTLRKTHELFSVAEDSNQSTSQLDNRQAVTPDPSQKALIFTKYRSADTSRNVLPALRITSPTHEKNCCYKNFYAQFLLYLTYDT